MTSSFDSKDKSVYATAIPIPVYSNPTSEDMRILQRDSSSYKLPEENGQNEINGNAEKRLKDQGFTAGLAQSLSTNNMYFPLRIWVVDNSGSMQMADGHRIVPSKQKNDVKFVECTRWAELKYCVNYHAQMAALLQAPTIFRFLNDPGVNAGAQQFSVAENSTSPAKIMIDVQNASTIMNKTKPTGVTPLIRHILEIQQSVLEMSPKLIKEGKRVAIIIATDGRPTDEYGVHNELISQSFVDSLRLLEGLPVWVVVRLCTDEEDVVDFYNELDEQLELSLEVLDDFVGEGKEVCALNPWLNYALPLHRCREMGYYDRLFDMLDERKLTKGELREFCALLFGETSMDGISDPEEDWDTFVRGIKGLNDKESHQWRPIKQKMCPWIDIKALNKCYGNSADCGSGCAVM